MLFQIDEQKAREYANKRRLGPTEVQHFLQLLRLAAVEPDPTKNDGVESEDDPFTQYALLHRLRPGSRVFDAYQDYANELVLQPQPVDSSDTEVTPKVQEVTSE